MVEMAAKLGTLHARTIGQQRAFERIRDGLGRRPPPEDVPIMALVPALLVTWTSWV